MNIFEELFGDLFSESNSNLSNPDGFNPEDFANRQMEMLKEQHGGIVQTDVVNGYKITKTWISPEGYIKKIEYHTTDAPDMQRIASENTESKLVYLRQLLETNVEEENYELCAIIRDKIQEIQKTDA